MRNVELTGPYMHNGSTGQEKGDLVSFMKALTDLRVRFSRAPFDDPAITIFNGHPGNQVASTARQPGAGPPVRRPTTPSRSSATGKFGAGNLVPFAPAP